MRTVGTPVQLLAMAGLLLGCREPTQILVHFHAESRAPVVPTVFEMDVTTADGEGIGRTLELDSIDDLPSYTLAPKSKDASRTYRLTARLSWSDDNTTSVSVSGGYEAGQTRELHLWFDAVCVNTSCPAGQTCERGACVAACAEPSPVGESDRSTLGCDDVDAGVPPDDGVVAIAAGANHTCAQTASGQVRCWGDNELGQLGLGFVGGATQPPSLVDVPGELVSLAAGNEHTCAVTAEGRVFCWGQNSSGMLGDGTSSPSLSPVAVVDVDDAELVTAGRVHTCVLRRGGEVSCWGGNRHGNLGTGDTRDQLRPMRVPLPEAARSVSAGSDSTCVVLVGGGVRCFGANDNLQIGAGLTPCGGTAMADCIVPMPTPVMDVPAATAIAVGNQHACALTESGTVWCWGRNFFGQTSEPRSGTPTDPTEVEGVSGATVVMASNRYHSAAIVMGQLRTWGWNEDGQLGLGHVEESVHMATGVTMLPAVQAVAGGERHTCAVTNEGAVYCWGDNGRGQLGLDPLSLPNTAFGVPIL